MSERGPGVQIVLALGALLAALAWTAHAGPAGADDTADRPTILIVPNPQDLSHPWRGQIFLRPKQDMPQEVAFFLVNPTDKARSYTLTVTAGGAQLFEGEAQEIPPGEWKPVKPVPAKAAPGAKASASVALKPPFHVEARIKENEKEWPPIDLRVRILHPRDYIEEPTAWWDGESRRLSVRAASKPGCLFGEPCPVKLVLPFSRQEETGRDEVRSGNLSAENETANVFTTLLHPREGTQFFYLDVDDYERAFTFEAAFAPDVSFSPTLVNWPVLRIEPTEKPAEKEQEPKFGRLFCTPDAKMDLRAQVDNLSPDAELSVELWPEKEKRKPLNDTARTARQLSIEAAAGQNGLVFGKVAVKDWDQPWEPKGEGGKKTWHARLLDAHKSPIHVFDIRAGVKDAETVTCDIVVGAEKPENMTCDFPERFDPNEPLTGLRAGAKTRLDKAPIESVRFFVGPLIAKGEWKFGPENPQAEHADGLPLTGIPDQWQQAPEQKLKLLPKDKKEVEISVLFETAAGVQEKDSRTIILEKNVPAVVEKTGTVAGSVVNITDLGVAGCTVELKDGKGNVFKTRTDQNGDYSIEVKFGHYDIKAYYGQDLEGSASVDVKDEGTNQAPNLKIKSK